MSIEIDYLVYLKNVGTYHYFKVEPHKEIIYAKVSSVDNDKESLTLEQKDGTKINKEISQIIDILTK